MNIKLLPKKFKHKKTFRNKKVGNFNLKLNNNNHNCIFIYKKFLISLNILVKFIRFLKSFFKNKSKNYRKISINFNFNYIYTKKVKGSRMGKGKGKYICWLNILKPGSIFILIKNFRKGKIKFLLKKLNIFFGNMFFLDNTKNLKLI